MIISDDICMKALKGDLLSNAKKNAFFQVVILCCIVEEYTKHSSYLLKGTNKIDKFTVKKTQQFYEFFKIVSNNGIKK